jgi:hypothetical protein
MTENESMDPMALQGQRSDAVAVPEAAPVTDAIDPGDEQVVPAALAALVAAAQDARAAVVGNGMYPAQVAVAAVEEVVAALAPMTRDFEAYAGDYSKLAEKHLVRVTGLLNDARADLGHARSQLEEHESVGTDTRPAAQR